MPSRLLGSNLPHAGFWTPCQVSKGLEVSASFESKTLHHPDVAVARPAQYRQMAPIGGRHAPWHRKPAHDRGRKASFVLLKDMGIALQVDIYITTPIPVA